MSITIRTRRAGGQDNSTLYETEAAGLKALEQNLNTHRNLGHTVTQNGDTYVVTDRDGTFVQESVVVPSV